MLANGKKKTPNKIVLTREEKNLQKEK